MAAVGREQLVRRGIWLEVATVGWNVIEGVIGVAAGALASSVALMAFGVDSFVETASGAVLWWRLRVELTGAWGGWSAGPLAGPGRCS